MKNYGHIPVKTISLNLLEIKFYDIKKRKMGPKVLTTTYYELSFQLVLPYKKKRKERNQCTYLLLVEPAQHYVFQKNYLLSQRNNCQKSKRYYK